MTHTIFVMWRPHSTDYESPNEKSKSRTTFPYDLECPIIVCTQSYTDSYDSRMVRRGCLSDTDSKVRPVTYGKTVDFV